MSRKQSGPFVLGAAATVLALVVTSAPAGAEPVTPTPTETAPAEAAPTESAPTETAPTETAPTETAPTETAPTETAPDQRVQAQAAPAATAVKVQTSAGTVTPQTPLKIVVTATSAGKPVSGATVVTTLEGTRDRRGTRVTDGNGRITLVQTGMVPGTYAIKAQLQGTSTLAPSTSPTTYARIQSGSRVSAMINDGRDYSVRPGENYALRGQVFTYADKPEASSRVKIYRIWTNGSRTLRATVPTNGSGWYTWIPANREAGVFQVQVSSTRYSQRIGVTIKSGTRSLESRALAARNELGAPWTSIRKVGSVRYRKYQRGVLTEYDGKTFLTPLTMGSDLAKQGDPGGKIGAPTSDHRCGLMEGACLQIWSKGALYYNASAKDKATSVAGIPGNLAKYPAVALSQVGYNEPSYRQSKYNRWIGQTGLDDAWCGYLQSWVAYAAGSPGAIVKANSFEAMASAERKRGRTASSPAVGRLAYMTYGGPVHHVGMIVKYDSSHIWTVEGNVDDNGGTGMPRGVNLVKRPRSIVAFYAVPWY